MATRRYTRSQLLHLRESPLVHKPENLHAIEQWIDDTQQNTQNASAPCKRPQPKAGGEASPMGNFSTGQRSSLVSRPGRAGTGEELPLGPPRTTFPSSRNITKVSDFSERGDSTSLEDRDNPRSKFFSGRQINRKSMQDREGDIARDSWTTVRERRQGGRDDAEGKDRHDRHNRRDRDPEGERRNGFGEKGDTRWGEKTKNGDRGGVGSWRDRERPKREPEWISGGFTEKNPEWMDDSLSGGLDDDLRTIGMSKKAEDFQKWKDERKMKESGALGKPVEQSIPQPEATPPPITKEPLVKPAETLKLDGLTDKPFGTWAEAKAATQEVLTTPGKSGQAAAKVKGSRFASMFKGTQGKDDAVLLDHEASQIVIGGPGGNAEDEAGFQRILKMLGSTGVSKAGSQDGPNSPQRNNGPQDHRERRPEQLPGFFMSNASEALHDGSAKPSQQEIRERRAEQLPAFFMSPHNDATQDILRHRGEDGNRRPDDKPSQIRGDYPSEGHATKGMMSPEPAMSGVNKDPRGQPGHLANLFLEQPPARSTASPDANIQNLLAGQRSHKIPGPDKNSEFLLNLLQNKGAHTPSQQPRPDNNFLLWLDQPAQVTEHSASTSRGLTVPAQSEEHVLRNQQQAPHRAEPQQMRGNEINHQRRPSQRAPPGSLDEQAILLQQQQQQQIQRRNFAEPPPQPARRNGPSQNQPQIASPANMGPFSNPPPEFLQSMSAHQSPPPGFHPHMPRHPPGFHNIPGMFPPPNGPQPPRDGQVPFPGLHGGIMPATSPLHPPPGFFGSMAPPSMPPGLMGPIRPPNEQMHPGLRGVRGFEGGMYDPGMSGARQ